MLFLKKKKQSISCACGGTCGQADVKSENKNCCCGDTADSICCVKVLGAGCTSCHQMYENVKEAVKERGLDIEVEYITDMQRVVSYGVMTVPALVINEKVVSAGKVLKKDDVLNFI